MRSQRLLTAFLAAIASIIVSACGGGDDKPTPGTTVTTLSNRADLVSGGSALVEVKVPGGSRPASLRVDRDGIEARRPRGRLAKQVERPRRTPRPFFLSRPRIRRL